MLRRLSIERLRTGEYVLWEFRQLLSLGESHHYNIPDLDEDMSTLRKLDDYEGCQQYIPLTNLAAIGQLIC